MRTSRLAACGVLFIGAAAIASPRIISDDRIALKAGVRCFGTTADSTLGDTEPLIAADPRRPDHLVTIWQTSGRIGSAVQWSASRDGGSTWTSPAIVPVNACAGGPVGAARASDPWAEFARDGRLYLSAIAWQADARGDDSVNALVVVASSDGGHRWQRPVVVARQAPGIVHDNLSVTADPTRARSAYLATTRIHRPDSTTYYGQLGFARTTDGGLTWSALRTLTPPRNQERIGAPRILVDPRSGRLYAIYHRRAREVSVVAVMRSDDGGDTWGEEHVIAHHVRGPRLTNPADGTRFAIADDIVHGAISPRTGELVVVFADARHSAGRQFGISVAMTPDGTRWTQPMDVSRDTSRTAWLPQVAIAPNGEIGISYYVAAFPAPPDTAQAEVILRRCTSVAGNLRENDREVLDEFGLRWPGDYHGLASSKSAFVAAYGRRAEIVVARSR